MSYAGHFPFMSVWRPTLPESIDGKPMVSTIREMFMEFPYERLPANPFLAVFLRPEGIAAMVGFYLISKPIFKKIATFVDPKSEGFRNAVAIHNLGLAIFSGLVAWNTWPIVFSHTYDEGIFATYCDKDGTLWNDAGFGAWAFIFYISKFYEFADTWVLILKHKQPSFLQVYHHTGIAFCMWGGVLSQSSWLIFVVLLNSVIHTLMYTYFLIKTLSPTTEIKSAKHLTKAQIGQFFTGITCSMGVIFMGDKCDTSSSRFALGCLQVYGYGLVALFMAFSKRKYKGE